MCYNNTTNIEMNNKINFNIKEKFIMKTFTVYRSTVQAVNETTDLINKVGWGGVKASGNVLANLKLNNQCLFEKEIPSEVKYFVSEAYNKDLILPVAEVVCNSIDEAFSLSNSINVMWTDNKEVTLLKTPSEMFLSSSSSGDIFKDNETGCFFIVLSVGFAEIDIT
jgi:hypothetical protein